MAKIPFTLEAWLKDKSQRVETRDGRIVHDIWEVKNAVTAKDYRTEVCALIEGEEDALVFFKNGKYLPVNAESPYDLFIVTPEPELTEFEQSVRNCIVENLTKHGREMSSTVFIDDDTAKKMAAELLDLVRKEQPHFADISKMERPNVDALREWSMRFAPDIRGAIESTAYHFWNLAINAMKEQQ